MASPQTENGYTRIADEILEALIRTSGLSGQELRLTLLILRKTFGFSKKEDRISLSQMCKSTGLSRVRCSQVINSLQLKRIVTVTENINGIGKKYRFNKDYEEWDTVKEKCNSYIKVKETVKEKCNHNKHSYNKHSYNKQKPSSEALRLSGLLADLILKNNPKHRDLSDGKRDITINRWATDIDRMLRIDKRNPAEIEDIIKWCQEDSFWRANILSGKTLREKFDRLYLARGKYKKDNGTKPSLDASGRVLKPIGAMSRNEHTTSAS